MKPALTGLLPSGCWVGRVRKLRRPCLEANDYTLEEAVLVADTLQLDNLVYVLRAPVYARRVPGRDGRSFYGEGLLRDRTDFNNLKLPDPRADSLYAEAEKFIEGKGDRSLWLITRFGIFPTIAGMGLEGFSLALYDDRRLVEDILDPLLRLVRRGGGTGVRLGFRCPGHYR